MKRILFSSFRTLLLLLVALLSHSGFAQCDGDSVAMSLDITTDAWGYEMYWELIPEGGSCGDGSALLWGGNPDVGCGDGILGLGGEVYGNNLTASSQTVCVAVGSELVLVHRDSYGDGGTGFGVVLNGAPVLGFQGTGTGNDWPISLDIVDELQGQLPCMPVSVEANGVNWVGSNEGASVLPGEVTPPAIGCDIYGSWCLSDPNATSTLWLSWAVPAEGGAYRISTCEDSTSFDTQLALWSAEDCADWESYTLINASDDQGCESAAYRSTMLTPCFEGGESLLIQIDGWGGQTGTVELSIQSTDLSESLAVGSSVSGLSCNLEEGFNPNGTITLNPNVGPLGASWNWSGALGSTYQGTNLSGLMPGTYVVEADVCGIPYNETIEVEEPEALALTVSLEADCELGAMGGFVSVGELEEFDAVTWHVGQTELIGTTVFDLPSGLCEVSVVSLEGCEVSEYVWVDVVGVPEVNLGPDVFACDGDLITLLGPLGNGLNYNWSTGASTPLLQFAAESGTTVLGLEVTDATGCSDSDVMVLTVDDCTSDLQDLSGETLTTTSWDGVLAVPNPFMGRTSLVGMSTVDVASWQLWDAQGRRVDVTWVQLGTEMALTSDLPAGVYTLTSPYRKGALRLVAQ